MWQPREITKSAGALTQEETLALLQKGHQGTLATADGEGFPLAIPFFFVYFNDFLYIHCGKKGHSLDNIAAQPQVSFCVVAESEPEYYNGTFTLFYKSVVVKGIAHVVDDVPEARRVMAQMCEKGAPGHGDKIAAAIDADFAGVTVIRIEPLQITGKRRKSIQPGH